ncbi:MAG: Acetate kinase [Clostridiales bacterium]|jgi:acetate kinase|nr:Acetate kinase [Clostridiales bacterium]
MKVLVLNCGSSSIKYKMFNMSNEVVLASGLVERIGMDGSKLIHKPTDKDKYQFEVDIPNHEVGINLILNALIDETHGVLNSMDEIDAIGHRTVHGGDKFSDSVLIDESVKQKLEDLIDLAPLHNPPGLMGINACERLLPNVPQVGVFDTAFHQTMPAASYTYALPYELCQKHKIRRYGFHGTSHKYVAYRAAELTGKDIKNCKIITCHLGNGASISAINNGKVMDTSMGFTPLEGLVMGTRCGLIDPAIIPFVMEKENLTTRKINELINKKSGVLGISGISSDFRDLEEAAQNGNERAQLALDVFTHVVKKTIGSYVAILNGVDVLVFTAGLGENSIYIREKICEGMNYLGITISKQKNNVRGEERIISKEGASTKVVIVPTNEELMIARDTKRIIEQQLSDSDFSWDYDSQGNRNNEKVFSL